MAVWVEMERNKCFWYVIWGYDKQNLRLEWYWDIANGKIKSVSWIAALGYWDGRWVEKVRWGSHNKACVNIQCLDAHNCKRQTLNFSIASIF